MPFVLIQILMVGLIITFPKLVSSGAGGGPAVDIDKAFQQMQKDSAPRVEPPTTFTPDTASSPAGSSSAGEAASDEEAMKRLLEAAPKKP